MNPSETIRVLERACAAYDRELALLGKPPEKLRAFLAEVPPEILGEVAMRFVLHDQNTRRRLGFSSSLDDVRAEFPELETLLSDQNVGLAEQNADWMDTIESKTIPSDTQSLAPSGMNGADQPGAEDLNTVLLDSKPQDFSDRKSDSLDPMTERLERNPVIETQVLDGGQIQVHASHPTTPQRIADYDILRELARGGMGVVFEARQRKLNRVVAIKMILAGQLASTEDVQRFYAEAEAAAGLEHPNIVPIYEVGCDSGQHFFSMALVDGSNLAARIRERPMNPIEIATLMQQVAEAVHYAHQRGIVHRDLKPANILLTKSGQPKITDFGLAKSMTVESDRTRSGQILGTPAFMAPEQAAGKAHLAGPSVDIYAIGAILYNCLTGRPTFQSDSLPDLLRQVIEQPPTKPSDVSKMVPRDLETICLKCLEKEPERRYQTASMVAAELGRFLEGVPIHARPTAWSERTWRWTKRHPLKVSAGVLVLLVIALGLISFGALRDSIRANSLTQASRRFEQKLSVSKLRTEDLSPLSDLIQQIKAMDPALAIELVNKRDNYFEVGVAKELDAIRLSDEDLSKLEKDIELLESFHPTGASKLRSKWKNRMRQWEIVAELVAPYDAWDKSIDPAWAEVVSQGIAGSRESKPIWTTSIPSFGDQQVEIEFAFLQDLKLSSDSQPIPSPGRQLSGRVGVSIDHSEFSDYTFVLTPPQLANSSEPPSPEGSKEPSSTNQTDSRLPSMRLEILRKGVLLRAQDLPSEILFAKRIRLFVTREGNKLSAQVNQLPTIVFEDLFPIANKGLSRQTAKANKGVLCLHVAPGVALASLRTKRRLSEQAANPLEDADNLHSSGDVDAAVREYDRILATLDESSALMDEVRYKYGISLLELNRIDEALRQFEVVAQSTKSKWYVPSMVQLWMILLERKKLDAAEDVFTNLSATSEFSEIASIIPLPVRDKILSAYDTNEFGSMQSMSSLLPDSKRVPRFQQLTRVLDLLDADSLASYQRRMELANHFVALGENGMALDLVQRLKKDARPGTESGLFQLECKALDPSVAPWRIVEVWKKFSETTDKRQVNRASHWILVAQAYKAMGDPYNLEQSIARLLHEYNPTSKEWDAEFWEGDVANSYALRRFAVMYGLMLEEEGRRAEALHLWNEVIDIKIPNSIRDGLFTFTSDFTYLYALTGRLTPELALPQAKRLLNSQASIAKVVSNVFNEEVVSRSISSMWQGKFGKRAIQDLAWGRTSSFEQGRVIARLLIYQYGWDQLLDGNAAPDQDEVFWNLTGDMLEKVYLTQELTIPRLLQLAAAWKGSTGLLGWQGLAAQLKPDLRGVLAYLLAKRSIRLNKPQDAKSYFEAAMRDLPSEHPLHAIAETEKTLLESNAGRVWIESQSDTPAEVIVQRDGFEQQKVLVTRIGYIDLPLGSHNVKIENDNKGNLQLSAATVSPFLGGHRRLFIGDSSVPGSPIRDQPGLLTHGKENAKGLRSQWVPRRSTQNHGAGVVRLSPDKQLVAVCHAGAVRVYDVLKRELVHVLPGLTIDWSPDGTRLATIAPFANRPTVWSVGNWRPVCELAIGAGQVRWMNNHQLVTSDYGPYRISVWDYPGERPLLYKPLYSREMPEYADVVDLSGDRLLVRNAKNQLVCFQAANQSIGEQWTYQATTGIAIAGFSPDASKVIVSSYNGSPDSQVLVLDGVTGKTASIVRGTASHANGVSWTQDSQFLFIASGDTHTYRCRVSNAPELAAEKLLSHLHEQPFWMHYASLGVASVDDEQLVVLSSDGKTQFVNLNQSEKTVAIGYDRPPFLLSLAHDPESRRIATLHGDGWVRLWSQQGKLQSKWGYSSRPASIRWHHEHKAFCIVYEGSKQVQELSPEDLSPLESWTSDEPFSRYIPIANSSNYALAIDSRFDLFSSKLEKLKSIETNTTDLVAIVHVSRDDSYLVAHSTGSIERFFADGTRKEIVSTPTRQITAVAISPDNSKLSIGLRGSQVWIRSLDSDAPPNSLVALHDVTRLSWDPSGAELAMAGPRGELSVRGVEKETNRWLSKNFEFRQTELLWLDAHSLVSTVPDTAEIRFWNTARPSESFLLFAGKDDWHRMRVDGSLDAASEMAREDLYRLQQQPDTSWKLMQYSE